MEGADFKDLPEGCISAILSFTSPRDACRLAAVSSMFHSAAECDSLWEKFVPSNYQEILSTSDQSALHFASKKELFFHLCDCDYILVDGGTKIFKLDKSTGRRCYMVGARQLSIAWGNTYRYWSWNAVPDSRFSEVAKLQLGSNLEICGRVATHMLSLQTTYTAYLIVKFDENWYGLGFNPTEVTIEVGNQVSRNRALLCPDNSMISRWDSYERNVGVHVPHQRTDGWMEIELGDFYNDVGDDLATIIINNVETSEKKGLIIDGIEIRPKS